MCGSGRLLGLVPGFRSSFVFHDWYVFAQVISVVSAAKRGFDDMMHVKFSHGLWYHVNASERLLLLD